MCYATTDHDPSTELISIRDSAKYDNRFRFICSRLFFYVLDPKLKHSLVVDRDY